MAARLVAVAGCAVALAGCDLAPAYKPPAVTVPSAFKEEVAAKPGKRAKTVPGSRRNPRMPCRVARGGKPITIPS